MPTSPDAKTTYLDIATRQFAEHGFHGVSLAAMAREAGVSKQALLHFFGTKERLYGEVLSALNERLCAEIEAARRPDPKAHLRCYFLNMGEAALTDQRDVRLVVRALLDSDPKAQNWPLMPYLDRLIRLVQALPGGTEMSRNRALNEAYRFIGSVQYTAISLPTIEGIYGPDAREALASTISEFAEDTIARLS